MQHVALLRGIGPVNPAMRNANLRRVVEALGYHDVRTVVTSGNVVLDAPARAGSAVEAELEAAWAEQLGFTSTTIVRTRDQLAATVAHSPFGDRESTSAASLQVTFLQDDPEPLLELPCTSGRGDWQVLAMGDRASYSVVDETGRPPDLLRVLERTFGTAMTTRSWKTVHRIAKAMAISWPGRDVA